MAGAGRSFPASFASLALRSFLVLASRNATSCSTIERATLVVASLFASVDVGFGVKTPPGMGLRNFILLSRK